MYLLVVLESGLHSLDFAKICQLMKKKKLSIGYQLYLVDLNEKLAILQVENSFKLEVLDTKLW